MKPVNQTTSPKKRAANLSIDAELLRQARELKINLSRVFEERLAEVVGEARREKWLEENRNAIAGYNERIGKRGSFGDRMRRF